jgi:hypothetical protein
MKGKKMSALVVKGKIVSIETFTGKSKKTGKEFTVHTCYIVNGSGAPIPLKIMETKCPVNQGAVIEVPVRANLFNNEISYYPETKIG